MGLGVEEKSADSLRERTRVPAKDEAHRNEGDPISGHGRKGTKTIRFTRDVDWLNKEISRA